MAVNVYYILVVSLDSCVECLVVFVFDSLVFFTIASFVLIYLID